MPLKDMGVMQGTAGQISERGDMQAHRAGDLHGPVLLRSSQQAYLPAAR